MSSFKHLYSCLLAGLILAPVSFSQESDPDFLSEETLDDAYFNDFFGNTVRGANHNPEEEFRNALSEKNSSQIADERIAQRNPNPNRRRMSESVTPPRGIIAFNDYDANNPETIIAGNQVMYYPRIHLGHLIHKNGRSELTEADKNEIFEYLLGENGLIQRLNEEFGTDLWIGEKTGNPETDLEKAREFLFEFLKMRPEAFLPISSRHGITQEQYEQMKALLALSKQFMTPEKENLLRSLQAIKAGYEGLSEDEKARLEKFQKDIESSLSEDEKKEYARLINLPARLNAQQREELKTLKRDALEDLKITEKITEENAQTYATLASKIPSQLSDDDKSFLEEMNTQIRNNLSGSEAELQNFDALMNAHESGISDEDNRKLWDLEQKIYSQMSRSELDEFKRLSEIVASDMSPEMEEKLSELLALKQQQPSPDLSEKYQNLAIHSLDVIVDSKRKVFASHGEPVGMVEFPALERTYGFAYNENWTPTLVGRGDLESKFENYLNQGTPGRATYTITNSGHTVDQEVTEEPTAGHTVKTTLDKDLQRILFDVVQRRAELDGKTRGVSAAWVDISSMEVDPETGKMPFGDFAAVVSYPTVDWSRLNPIADNDYMLAIENDPMKPNVPRVATGNVIGSIGKVWATLGAMNGGDFDEYRYVEAPGSVHVEGMKKPVSNWNSKHEGRMDPTKILMRSHNPATINYTRGYANYVRDMFHQLGMTNPNKAMSTWATGTMISPEERAHPIERGLNSIGQGQITATPADIALAMAGIARGKVPQGNFLHGVIDANGNPVQIPTEEYRSEPFDLNVDDDKREVIRQGMFKVVNVQGGTASSARHWSLCVYGKTSTAQWRETRNDMLALFAGWIEKCKVHEDGRIETLGYLYSFAYRYESEPDEKVSGGKTAAQMFARTLHQLEMEGHLDEFLGDDSRLESQFMSREAWDEKVRNDRMFTRWKNGRATVYESETGINTPPPPSVSERAAASAPVRAAPIENSSTLPPPPPIPTRATQRQQTPPRARRTTTPPPEEEKKPSFFRRIFGSN